MGLNRVKVVYSTKLFVKLREDQFQPKYNVVRRSFAQPICCIYANIGEIEVVIVVVDAEFL